MIDIDRVRRTPITAPPRRLREQEDRGRPAPDRHRPAPDRRQRRDERAPERPARRIDDYA